MSTNDVISEVLEKADIVEVVSDFVKLEKAGTSYKGLCPFHNDNNPSFYVSPTKKICKCMVCHTGGNAITILEKLAKISFNEALQRLCDRYGIKYVSKESKKVATKKGLFQITKYAANFYNHYLLNSLPGAEALKYLRNRGIDDDIIKTFKIGLAPSGKSTLYLSLKDQGYTDNDMLNAGVISNLDNIHDTFTNRIMFPITDEENNYVGFSGRIYYESNDSKYFNSLDNELFKKGCVIYNLCNALDAIRKNRRIIIMEGFMDVIAAYKVGLKECVCLMGTALTKEHIEKIKSLKCDVILCLDGDEAGQNATYRSIKLLLENKINAYSVVLSDNLDPDEYIKEYGKEQFMDIFEKGLIDSYTFIYNYLKGKNVLTTLVGEQSFSQSIYDLVISVKNALIKEKLLNLLSNDVSIDRKTIDANFNEYLNKRKNKNIIQIESVKKEPDDCINGILETYHIVIKHMLSDREEFYRIDQALEKISALQTEKIPNSFQIPLISLIYKENNLDIEDGYFNNYIDFISKISDYFNEYRQMDIDKFYNTKLSPELKMLYDDKLRNVLIASKDKRRMELDDCYRKFNLFILQCGIDKYKEMLKKNEISEFEYADKMLTLKREKVAITATTIKKSPRKIN
ncbi:MAG: DNA primase [bacterium]|nr:DNA primase [bacterium]